MHFLLSDRHHNLLCSVYLPILYVTHLISGHFLLRTSPGHRIATCGRDKHIIIKFDAPWRHFSKEDSTVKSMHC